VTILYFAGAEAHWHRFVRFDVPFVMFSWFKNRNKDYKERLRGVDECRRKGIKCVLDSGAHSLQVRPELAINPYDYKERYFRFLEIYHRKFEWVVELDIDPMVGMDRVKEWRKELEDRGIDNFIPVWHGAHGRKEWEELINRYDYVGTQTKLKLVPEKVLWRNLKLAARTNTKVHGFGMSDAKPICLYFTSLDSTSWQRAPKYGVLDWFTGGQKQSWTHDHFRKIESDTLHGLGIKLWLKYATFLREMGQGPKGLA